MDEGKTVPARPTPAPPTVDRRHYAQILDAIADMVLVKGYKSQLLWANKAFRDYYGMTNKQLRGIVDAPFNEPDYTQQYVRDDAQVYNTGQILDIPVEPVTRYDGTVRLFHTVKSPIRGEDGKVGMTVGVSRDITEELRVKGEIEAAHARAYYSARMASLGEMAAGVAHEINTPLAVIQLLAGELRHALTTEKPDLDELAASAKTIEETCSRIANIIIGLRLFSRDASKDPFAKSSLAKIIESTMAFSSLRFADAGVRVEVEGIDPELSIDCRPAQISQVFVNLLNNAFAAVLKQKDPWIRLTCRREGDVVEIRVANSGDRIPKSIESRLFTPFFTMKDVGEGTGLGLAISLGIVQEHGGTISVDPETDHTEFVIRLPISGLAS